MLTDKPTIFVAWSGPTEEAAAQLVDILSKRGLNVWMSHKIEAGTKYRDEIRRRVLNSHAVVAIFPDKPSAWQIAEAGLAYFDNKLIPVAVDNNLVVEPFGELEVYPVASGDLAEGKGESLDKLTTIISSRIGEIDRLSIWDKAVFYLNNIFFVGVPVGGVLLQLYLFSLTLGEEHDYNQEFWRAAHTALGAIVYGGGVFTALVFSRAGTSANASARRLTFAMAKRLFFLWMALAIVQIGVGANLWYVSPWGFDAPWIAVSVVVYLLAIVCALLGYIQCSTAYRLEKEQASLVAVRRAIFVGNAMFGLMIIMMTFVIMGMSMKSGWIGFLQADT